MSVADATTISSRLASWAASTRDLEPDIVEDVRRRVLDSTGIMLAASAVSPEGAAIRRLAEGLGSGGAVAIGGQRRLAASSAALVNGTLAHSLDFDDTHLPSVLHPSASVVPTAIAVAQDESIHEGSRLLSAIAVGIEIANRIGMGSYDRDLGNSVMFEHGFHATSICGAIGSAAAAAHLLGLSADGIQHSMGIAASMGSGILEANRTGGSVKKTHCGWAAHAGIFAAQFARAGITGAPTAFEGRFGFFEAFSRGFMEEEAVIGSLGEHWELLRTHFKPYPSNHFTHAAVDAALELRAQGLVVDEVSEIQLGVAAPTLRTIAQPEDVKARPATPYAAQFSGPFVLARALRGGDGLGLHLSDFTDETIADPLTLELASKVECFADEAATKAFPNAFPAVVRAVTNDGREWHVRIDHNRGGPDRPLSDDELAEKFQLNAGLAIEQQMARELSERILSLGAGTTDALFSRLGASHA